MKPIGQLIRYKNTRSKTDIKQDITRFKTKQEMQYEIQIITICGEKLLN